MRRAIVSAGFLIILITGGCNPTKSSDHNSSYSINSALRALEIAELLQEERYVDEKKWSGLFKSEGYKKYLIYADSLIKKKLIKDALITVFVPDQKRILDSLLAIPIEMDENFLKLSIINNMYQLKNNRPETGRFLKHTDFDALISSGDSLAKTYLPESLNDSLPELYDIHFILSDPDAKVMEDAIVFDLNTAVRVGEDKLMQIIAHEYHHNYRKLTTRKFSHPLMIQLNKIHQEGVADLIDKDKPPIKELGLFPQSLIDAYNTDYKRTPDNLKRLDKLTNSFLAQEIDTASYYGELNNYFKFGGHTTGIYMSFKISEELGKDILIESYNDPVKFIFLYNQIAQNSENYYAFSDNFIKYITQLNR